MRLMTALNHVKTLDMTHLTRISLGLSFLKMFMTHLTRIYLAFVIFLNVIIYYKQAISSVSKISSCLINELFLPV